MTKTFLTKRQDQIRPLLDKMVILKTEIATLQNQKLISEQDLQEYQINLANVQNELNDLNSLFDKQLVSLTEFVDTCDTSIKTGVDYIKKAETIIAGYFKVLSELENKIVKAKHELLEVKEYREKELEKVREEEKRLSSHRRSLDIYKERLQSKAKELGINIVIRF